MANSGSHHYSGRKALSEIDRKEKKRQYKVGFSSAVTFEYLQVPGGGGSLPQKAVIHVLPVPGQILSDAVLGGCGGNRHDQVCTDQPTCESAQKLVDKSSCLICSDRF